MSKKRHGYFTSQQSDSWNKALLFICILRAYGHWWWRRNGLGKKTRQFIYLMQAPEHKSGIVWQEWFRDVAQHKNIMMMMMIMRWCDVANWKLKLEIIIYHFRSSFSFWVTYFHRCEHVIKSHTLHFQLTLILIQLLFNVMLILLSDYKILKTSNNVFIMYVLSWVMHNFYSVLHSFRGKIILFK